MIVCKLLKKAIEAVTQGNRVSYEYLMSTCRESLRPMPRSAVCILSVGLALLLLPLLLLSFPASASGQWTPSQEAALARGEAVAEVVPTTGAGGRVRAAINISATPAVVWATMLDCAAAPRYVPGLRSCRIIETAPDALSDVREHRIRWTGMLPEMRLRFRSRYQVQRSIAVELIEGDLSAMRGQWRMQPINGGRAVRLDYDFLLVPRVPVPAGMVRSGMVRDAPGVMQAVRDEALRRARG
jgi:ribosome-associated toxin RatA of RatAB toxin-antitoxin module